MYPVAHADHAVSDWDIVIDDHSKDTSTAMWADHFDLDRHDCGIEHKLILIKILIKARHLMRLKPWSSSCHRCHRCHRYQQVGFDTFSSCLLSNSKPSSSGILLNVSNTKWNFLFSRCLWCGQVNVLRHSIRQGTYEAIKSQTRLYWSCIHSSYSLV